jgi:hypothetical protein
VCFRPPFAQAPASLAVYLADAKGRPIDGAALTWASESEGEGALGTTSHAEGLTFVHGLKAGNFVRLEATSDDRSGQATAALGSGVTEAVLTLPALSDTQ